MWGSSSFVVDERKCVSNNDNRLSDNYFIKAAAWQQTCWGGWISGA